jgi:hypothetical protein
MAVRVACGSAAAPAGWLVGAAAVAVCVLAAWLARAASRFLDQLALGLAAVFALAIAYQALAAGIVPSCAR